MNIVGFIPVGKQNAIPLKELSIRAGCTPRTVQKLVENARLNGAVICNSLDTHNHGLYIPSCPDEALHYVRTERMRIDSFKRSLQSAEEYISDVEQG